jgi:hypothetical protein
MRNFLVVSVLLVFAAVLFAGDKIVFVYYYPWYASEGYDGEWRHWEEYGHNPPWDISSSYYPKLGPYSSADPAVVDQHMRWIAGAGIHAIIYSWWGRNDFSDSIVKTVLDSALDYNLKVTFLIEPYPGRTVRNICTDIEYLHRRYGGHPAFLYLKRQRAIDERQRPVYFIYHPDFPDEELRELSGVLHTGSQNPILLLQSTDASMLDRTGADGIFAYEAVISMMNLYEGILEAVKERNGIFVPCVSPGFNLNRSIGRNENLFRPRRYGKTYDHWWEKTLVSNPEFVAIVSFNEWHEGTQIEPAIPVSRQKPRYLSYEKAYGKTGSAAQEGYLSRTAAWIDLLLQLQP